MTSRWCLKWRFNLLVRDKIWIDHFIWSASNNIGLLRSWKIPVSDSHVCPCSKYHIHVWLLNTEQCWNALREGVVLKHNKITFSIWFYCKKGMFWWDLLFGLLLRSAWSWPTIQADGVGFRCSRVPLRYCLEQQPRLILRPGSWGKITKTCKFDFQNSLGTLKFTFGVCEEL